MDLWQALGIIIRRWYVFVPIVLLAFVIAWQASGTINPEYTARASAILINRPVSETKNQPTTPNAWSDLPVTAKAIQLTVQNDSTRNKVAAEHLVKDYAIGVENRSPILEVATSSGSAKLAQKTSERVLNLMSADLERKQALLTGAVPTHVDMQVLAEPNSPTVSDGGRSRVRVLILALGVLAAASAAFFVDGWASRRKDPRRAQQVAATGGVLASHVHGNGNGDAAAAAHWQDTSDLTSSTTSQLPRED